jgi:hypothetical protein
MKFATIMFIICYVASLVMSRRRRGIGDAGNYCSPHTPCNSGLECINHVCKMKDGARCHSNSQCKSGNCDGTCM